MGVVHRAHDPSLRRDVAIKRLFPGTSTRRRDRKRILNEARAMARVGHPNVVQIYDAGVTDDELFIAMELLPGPTLRRCAERSWREIVRLYCAAGRGLEALHGAGLVHRDFKPDNVLLSGIGAPKVMDLGLAKRLQAIVTTTGGGSAQSSTVRAVPPGSFPYLAPELFEGRAADSLSDQFAFCVSLFETLTKRRPFEATSPWGHWLAVTNQRPSATRSEMPRAIWTIIERGLARDPAERWSTIGDLVDRLEACLSRRLPKVALGLATTGAIGAALPSPEPPPPIVSETAACVEPLSLAWTDDAKQRLDAHFAELKRDVRFPGSLYATERIEGALARLETMNQECVAPPEATCRARLATRLRLTMDSLARIDGETLGTSWAIVAPLSDECSVTDTSPIEDSVAIDEMLVTARHRGLTEGLDGASALVREAVARAEATGSSALVVGTKIGAADVVKLAGDPAQAVELYGEAAWTAEYDNRPEDATHAALAAAHVAANELRDPELARLWLGRAEVEQAEQPLLWARLLATRALVARAHQRFEDAEADMRQAARIRSALAPAEIESAQTWSAVAAMLQYQGRHLEALRLHAHALEMLVEASDPLHPDVAVPLYGLASAHLSVGDLEGAELLARTLIAVEPLSHGPGHPSHVWNGLLLIEILAQQGRMAEALQTLDGVETLATELFEAEDPVLAGLVETRENLLVPT